VRRRRCRIPGEMRGRGGPAVRPYHAARVPWAPRGALTWPLAGARGLGPGARGAGARERLQPGRTRARPELRPDTGVLSTLFHTWRRRGGSPRDALISRGGGCVVDEGTASADNQDTGSRRSSRQWQLSVSKWGSGRPRRGDAARGAGASGRATTGPAPRRVRPPAWWCITMHNGCIHAALDRLNAAVRRQIRCAGFTRGTARNITVIAPLASH